jgi:hypothetical protein
MNILSRFIVLGVFVFCFALVTSAQGQSLPEAPPPMPHKVEQFKKMRLIEELQLDEETSIRFFVRYNKQMDEIREIERQRNAVIKQLKELNLANAPSGEIETAIKNYIKLGGQVVGVRTNFIDGLKEIFTPKQIAEYLIFEQKFSQNLREVLRDMTRERMGRMQ